jgi:oligopeptidase B
MRLAMTPGGTASVLLLATILSCAHKGDLKMKPPVAATKVHVTKIHGLELQDPYFWLREKENPEVISHLNAENAFTENWFADTKSLEAKLYKDILGFINEDDESVPYPDGAYVYGRRIKKGQQYPTYFRAPRSDPSRETVYLDADAMGKNEKFFSIGDVEISPNDGLLAFSTDTVGFRQYKLFVKDLSTGKIQGPIADKVGSVAWAADNKTLFYTIEDHAKRQYRVLKHVLGEDPSSDKVVFEEPDERFRVYVTQSRDSRFVLTVVSSHTTSEYRYIPADAPDAAWTVVLPRRQDIEYSLDVHADEFYIRLNDKGPNFRIVKTPIKGASLKTLTEVIAYDPKIAVTDHDVFKTFMVVHEQAEGLPRFKIVPFQKGAKPYLVKLPEAAYDIYPMQNAEYDTQNFRYGYQSFISPEGTYELNAASGESKLLKEKKPPTPYDKSQFQVERVFASAADGTKIPVSLVYRKDLFKKGQNPSHVYAYGSYGYPMSVSFSASRFALLNRGFVMSIAHIRGGGEYGKAWHDAGKMEKKMNTFNDFIASVEHLVKEGYVAKDQVFVEGGSAGGLLMGAITNMRPDLFRGVISHVPFVDVLNTMLDASLPLTVGEYEEWGNPNERPAFDRMRAYSPYDNLKEGAYPAIYVRTSIHDSQVMYWEPAKYVAKLRTLKRDTTPLLLQTNMEAGHGGASGRYDAYKERARDLAFILKIIGRTEN